ncbi:MAG: hypothetical protein M9932_00825 [Xanthobacteraceae bacterium]|nr:hypothetical protein [Xanthobacteraceae bacterium]
MLGRTLGSAALAIAVGFSLQVPARAQNLEAGKSPAQIFNGACAACHKSPRGLVKTVPPGSLPGFLRQHYTTSGEMAGALSGYLLANGGVDRRPAAEKPRRGREAKPAAAQEPAPAPAAPAPSGWWPFHAASPAPQAAPEAARPSRSKSSAKHRAKAKKSKAAPPQDDATQQPTSNAAGSDGTKPQGVNSPASKPEPAHSAPAQRPDPVPAVTPAPAAEPKVTEPKVTEPRASEPAVSTPPASEPKSSEPKASEPKASEPKAAEPKAD